MKYFLFSILLLGCMTTQAQTVTMPDGSTRPLGDMDGDGEVNISDVTALVNKILGKTPAPVSVLSCPDDHHPHLIDLGLPSGTLWSCCNVGASSPEGYGSYYAWGETQTKDVYNWNTYQYGYYNFDGDDDYSHLVDIGSDIAGTPYDAATANWGAPWRMPSLAQIQELFNNCSSQWTQQNGVNGRLFTGPNGNSVFLPAAGDRWNGELYGEGSNGLYWSSSLVESTPNLAYYLYSDYDYYCDFRYVGHTVRPVRKN